MAKTTQPTFKPGPRQLVKPQPNIRSSSDIEQLRVSVLYQGRGGTGKTTCALSFPSPLVFHFDLNEGTIMNYPGVPMVSPTWEELREVWLPAITTRKLTELVQDDARFSDYTVQTIVLDSLTAFCDANFNELSNEGYKDLGYDGWGMYYTRVQKLLAAACGATKAKRGLETYNVAATIHEDTKKDDKGNVKSIQPAVQGRMSNFLDTYFTTHLLTDHRKAKNPDGTMKTGGEMEFVCYTTSQGHRKCKPDQIGTGERFQALPAVVGGSYSDLARLWGLENV